MLVWIFVPFANVKVVLRSSITGVANLACLQKLVLTANRITELQGLTGLPALRHLLLQGNLLCTLQDINLTMLVSPKLSCLQTC